VPNGLHALNDLRIPAVVLAGGQASAEFQQKAGVAKRCLVKHGGRTLLEIVADALRQTPAVDRVIVVGDVPAPPDVQVLPEGDGFVANLFLGLQACAAAPLALVSTSDMPFLTPEVVRGFIEGAVGLEADMVYPIVPVELCAQAYPGMRRTSLRLREGRFTGGNMILLRPDVFLRRRRHIEAAYAYRKQPLRLAMMLGPAVALGVALSIVLPVGLLELATLERAASRLLHAQARALILEAPALAADVDKPADLSALKG